MPQLTLPEISQRLSEELETILGRSMQPGDTQRPLHELGVDSIGLVELLVTIENTFGLSLMEAGLEAEDFRTVERLSSVIHDRLK